MRRGERLFFFTWVLWVPQKRALVFVDAEKKLLWPFCSFFDFFFLHKLIMALISQLHKGKKFCWNKFNCNSAEELYQLLFSNSQFKTIMYYSSF